jgi:GNAT superfamily N-acetyltransferase
MSKTPDIRLAAAEETPALLDFIQTMGFNPRDATSWNGLEMLAMSAWQEGRLIGAIPLEPRPIRIAAGKSVWAMHETVVAVHPEDRSRGIGSAMQTAIFECLEGQADFVSVFREEPQSPAYRWYVKNGFVPAMHIDSWFHETALEFKVPELDLLVPNDERLPWALLADIWRESRQTTAGFVDQSQRPLQTWLAIHPYRHRYNFILAIEPGRQNRPRGYALLGTGDMHSESKRCDILDVVSTGGDADVRYLLNQLLPLATKLGCQSTRWPLADTDPNIQSATDLGFEKRWGFDMLIRPVSSPDSSFILHPSSPGWRYVPIDYI